MDHEHPKRVRRMIGRELKQQRRVSPDFSGGARMLELFAEQVVLIRLSRRAEVSTAKRMGTWPYMLGRTEHVLEFQQRVNKGLGL